MAKRATQTETAGDKSALGLLDEAKAAGKQIDPAYEAEIRARLSVPKGGEFGTDKEKPKPDAEDRIPLGDGWQEGPLPPQTYNWGGVQLVDEPDIFGFHFADFRGNHVLLPMRGNVRIESYKIRRYNNTLTAPGYAAQCKCPDDSLIPNAVQ